MKHAGDIFKEAMAPAIAKLEDVHGRAEGITDRIYEFVWHKDEEDYGGGGKRHRSKK